MKTADIEFITSPMGDWIIVNMDGKRFHSDHDLDPSALRRLLEACGACVREREISDEEMEEQC